MVIVSGMERMTFEVLRTLSEHGAQVHCVLNSWGNTRIRPFVDAIGASWSTGRYRVPLTRRTLRPLRLLAFAWDVLVTSLGLVRDGRRFRPTHVLVTETFSVLKNAPTLLAMRALGLPVLLRVPNAPERGRKQEWLWRFAIAPCLTTIVVNSEFARARCLECGLPERKLRLIRNRVSARSSAANPRPDETALELVRERKTLLTVGQIAPFKGTHLAVEALASLLDAGDDVQLVVLGTIPTRKDFPDDLVDYVESLRRDVADRGHESRVHFLGNRDDVLELMRASYLLLAPILQEETFGNVVLEAKSVGLPAVVFRRGGLPELVEHEATGFLCETTDAAGLIEGVRFFLDSPEQRQKAHEESLLFFESSDGRYGSAVFTNAWLRLFSMETDFDQASA